MKIAAALFLAVAACGGSPEPSDAGEPTGSTCYPPDASPLAPVACGDGAWSWIDEAGTPVSCASAPCPVGAACALAPAIVGACR